MTSKLADLLKQADALSPDEQRELLDHLARRQHAGNGKPIQDALRWQDVRGCAPGLASGDAQDWVSASRREDQDHSDRGRP